MIEKDGIKKGFRFLDLRSPYNSIQTVIKVNDNEVRLKEKDWITDKVRYYGMSIDNLLRWVNKPMIHIY